MPHLPPAPLVTAMIVHDTIFNSYCGMLNVDHQWIVKNPALAGLNDQYGNQLFLIVKTAVKLIGQDL